MKRLLMVFTLLISSSLLWAQTSIDDNDFSTWLSDELDFITFDIRGQEGIDSIIYPCFQTEDIESWIGDIACQKRFLIISDSGIDAQASAVRLIGFGYAKDSIYTSGYTIITSSRFPLRDTMPLSYLKTDFSLPQNLSANQLCAVRASKRDFLLIDVRRTDEITSGMIPDACNYIWSAEFQNSISDFGKDQDIILYCMSGARSGQARDYLLSNGFSQNLVINFGGFSKWSNFIDSKSFSPTDDCRCREDPVPIKNKANPKDWNIIGTNYNLSINSNALIQVFDISGRKIKTIDLSVTSLNILKNQINKLNGIFILRIYEGDHIEVKRVVTLK